MAQADETLRGKAMALLDEGEGYFKQAISEARAKPGHEHAAAWGHNEVALIITPTPQDSTIPLEPSFLNAL
jgi:hypothetical protein